MQVNHPPIPVRTARATLKWVVAYAVIMVSGAAGAAENYCLLEDGPAKSDWHQIFVSDGVTVYSQKQPTTDILALRATGVIEAPVEQVMEVLRQVEISSQWMPDIEEKYTLKEVSDFEAITYSVNRLPWPLSDRELILRNALRLDAHRKYMVVDVYSVDEDAPPTNGDHVRAYMHCGRTRFRPADADRTEIDLVLFVDPRGYMPSWFVNMAQRRMPYNFLKALEQKAQATTFPLRPAFQQMLDELRSLM